MKITASANKNDAGGSWTEDLVPADLVLAPAACYPIYPIAAARGVVPDQGYVFDVASDCFRHEPSRSIDRFQTFRMREYVRVGSPDQIKAFRDPWIARAQDIADAIGLAYKAWTWPMIRSLAASARLDGGHPARGRLEIRTAHSAGALQESPTACMSFNYHKEHFEAEVWGLQPTPGGDVLHTGCVAFGMDRGWRWRCSPAMAPWVKAWPASVRGVLEL